MILLQQRLDIRTIPEKNRRDHRYVKSSRTKRTRSIVNQALYHRLTASRMALKRGEHLEILVTRLAPSNGLDEHDGLRTALSAVVDGIADALGLSNDRHPQIRWAYDQARSAPRVYAIEVRVETEAA